MSEAGSAVRVKIAAALRPYAPPASVRCPPPLAQLLRVIYKAHLAEPADARNQPDPWMLAPNPVR